MASKLDVDLVNWNKCKAMELQKQADQLLRLCEEFEFATEFDQGVLKIVVTESTMGMEETDTVYISEDYVRINTFRIERVYYRDDGWPDAEEESWDKTALLSDVKEVRLEDKMQGAVPRTALVISTRHDSFKTIALNNDPRKPFLVELKSLLESLKK